jgi:hypothetical protein
MGIKVNIGLDWFTGRDWQAVHPRSGCQWEIFALGNSGLGGVRVFWSTLGKFDLSVGDLWIARWGNPQFSVGEFWGSR